MKKQLFSRLAAFAALWMMVGGLTACGGEEPAPTPDGPKPPVEEEFDGVELKMLLDAGYRTDNEAGAGNYEVVIGNASSLMWEGDVMVVLDFYNEADADPLNAVLPTGTYLPNSDCSPFSYGVQTTYVELMMADGTTEISPIFGEIKVERQGPTYTITVEGTLMMLGDAEFNVRYTGPIAFTQRGTAEYERFDKAQNVTFDYSQGRYWGGWFYPFADDLGLEFFQGEFDENNTLVKGYYLHLSPLYMPKYANYNAADVPLAEGVYHVTQPGDVYQTSFALPYTFDYGESRDIFEQKVFMGTYLTYVDRENNISKVGFVREGTVTVSGSGDNYTLIFDFKTEEGVAITAEFNGDLNLYNYCDNDQNVYWNNRPWTTLEADHTYNFLENTTGYALLMGDYIKKGLDNWMIMIQATDEAGEVCGDYFTTELLVDDSNGYVLPTGTFEVSWELADHVMLPGYRDFGQTILFTNYADATLDAEGYSTALAPIVSGQVTISQEGENYKFVFDMVDDGGNKITGEWSGPMECFDVRDDMGPDTGDEDHDHAHSLARHALRRR